MIEFYFINWRSPYTIASDFRLNNTSAVYRHARALDLFRRRSQNIRAMLEILFEKAGGSTHRRCIGSCRPHLRQSGRKR
jgi:hypothetical protein